MLYVRGVRPQAGFMKGGLRPPSRPTRWPVPPPEGRGYLSSVPSAMGCVRPSRRAVDTSTHTPHPYCWFRTFSHQRHPRHRRHSHSGTRMERGPHVLGLRAVHTVLLPCSLVELPGHDRTSIQRIGQENLLTFDGASIQRVCRPLPSSVPSTLPHECQKTYICMCFHVYA